ncbi:MAG: helix-turn-helix domain-containing protein [Verrucomicrobia bacterium]|nr:helix-turn-helix domain-containing protein [Verrucomicrobiota bacterium]
MKAKETGVLIRKRRMSLRIDQHALSEISGISVHTLSNIEKGKGNPTVATLDRVLNALGMQLCAQIKD